MAKQKSDKDVMSVQLTAAARDCIDELSAEYGLPKTRLVEKVLEWLKGLPKDVQHLALVPMSDSLRPVYAAWLEDEARRLRDPDFVRHPDGIITTRFGAVIPRVEPAAADPLGSSPKTSKSEGKPEGTDAPRPRHRK